jgi:predicted TPR repeat methyltransferase
MHYSDPDNKDWIFDKLSKLEPKSVLDVGAGAGVYGKMARSLPSVIRLDAIEIWEPYINKFALPYIYDTIYKADAREHEDFDYDVVIFGDVLEHMTREEAVALYDKARAQARAVIFSIPIIHLPQGPYEGNPYETHVEEDWTHDEIIATFDDILDFQRFRVTGAYFSWSPV